MNRNSKRNFEQKRSVCWPGPTPAPARLAVLPLNSVAVTATSETAQHPKLFVPELDSAAAAKPNGIVSPKAKPKPESSRKDSGHGSKIKYFRNPS